MIYQAMSRRLLILGGGYAGLSAAKHAAGGGAEVQLVDRSPVSVSSPLLPDLISGRVDGRHMAYDLVRHCRRRRVEFRQAEVRSIDAGSKRVETGDGDLTADAIVVCLGCETNYFGSDEIRQRTLGLKTICEGRAIAKGAAERMDRGRAELLVVGGGYTGFEAASHLALLARRRSGRPYARLAEVARIRVLEKSDEPLRNVPEGIRDWAWRKLERCGVEVVTGCTVEQIEPDGAAMLSTGERVDDALVVWTPGVTPGAAVGELPAADGHRGRLSVDRCLQVSGTGGVFAAGDVAAAVRPGAGRPLRMGVQFSLAGGARAAANALRWLAGRELKPFDPLDPGYLVPLGPGFAAGVVLGITLRGRVPLAMHYGMCAFRSWGVRNKVGIVTDLMKGTRS